jgi:Ca2+-dependent lipid-binding protein
VFNLNGQKVFKSQTKKKTVNPEWNESFEVSVVCKPELCPIRFEIDQVPVQPSRVGADFTVELFDWNQIEQAKSLGVGKIDLASLEPFAAREVSVNLSSPKHGAKGQIRMRFVFQPSIIAKSRKNTSTFTSAGRAMTQLGGLPVNAGKGVFHGVAGGVAGIAGVFKRGDKDADDSNGVPPDFPAGQSSHPIETPDTIQGATASFPSSDDHANHEPGTLRVTVLDAKDLSPQDAKPYATLRVGDKEFKTKHTGKTSAPEWQVSFS